MLVSFIAGGVLVYFGKEYIPGTTAPPPRTTAALQRTKISALGRLAPRGGVIPVFGPPGDRVLELKVTQGDQVKLDQPLAILASRDDRQLELTLAQLKVKEAKEQEKAIREAGEKKLAAIDAEIEQVQAGRESDLRAQNAKIDVLSAQHQSAENALARLKSLKLNQASTQDKEHSELLVTQAQGELTAARALRDKTALSYSLNEKAAMARRRAAEAELTEALKRVPLESADQNLKIAERRLDASTIKAPIAGRILKIIGQPGDPTGVTPILQMADTRSMVAIAEVYETDIQELSAWLKDGPVVASIRSRAIPGGPLKGAVKPEQVAWLIERNQVFSLDPRADIDRRVIEVRVELDPESTEQAARFIGMQVEVELQQRPKP
jgi:HlyD family secretion protein